MSVGLSRVNIFNFPISGTCWPNVEELSRVWASSLFSIHLEELTSPDSYRPTLYFLTSKCSIIHKSELICKGSYVIVN